MISGAEQISNATSEYVHQDSISILEWLNSQIAKDVPSVFDLRNQLMTFRMDHPADLKGYNSEVVNALLDAAIMMLDTQDESLQYLHQAFQRDTQYTVGYTSMLIGWLGFNPKAKFELPILTDIILDSVETEKYVLEAIKRIGGLELPFVISTIKDQLKSDRPYSFMESICLAVNLSYQDSEDLFEIVNMVSQGDDEGKRSDVASFLVLPNLPKQIYRPILDRLLKDSSELVRLWARRSALTWDA